MSTLRNRRAIRPIAGIGVGLRRPFAEEILATERRVDWLEVTPENWIWRGGLSRRQLDACAERWPISPHSVSLSIGGLDALDAGFLDGIDALCAGVGAPFWSDHLCYSTVGGKPTHDLLPLPFTDEAVEHAAARVRVVQHRIETPLLLENATYYAHMPGGTLDEAEFLRRVIVEGDCGMLLDVNNVYVNSLNHGFEARAFIDRLPLDRVRQIHVAGHTLEGDTVIDTHIGPVIDEVWALYRHAIARIGRLVPTLVEWDQDIPPLDRVLDEVDRARREAAQALPLAPVAAALGRPA